MVRAGSLAVGVVWEGLGGVANRAGMVRGRRERLDRNLQEKEAHERPER